MQHMEVTGMAKPTARSWYEIRNAAGDVAEVYIYEQIGENFWTGEGVTAKRFATELNAITAPEIHLRINSPGGSVWDANAIHGALKRHPAKVTSFIDGLAASAASYIALAGDHVVMAANALYMIHNPMGSVMGDANDMRKMADVLDKIRETIVGVYEDKTGLPTADLIDAMDAETWYTAQEALDAGFIDEIGVALEAAASIDTNVLASMGYKHIPKVVNVGVDTDPQTEGEPAEDTTATDSETDGASDSAASGGAPEAPNSEAFVQGIGFVRF